MVGLAEGVQIAVGVTTICAVLGGVGYRFTIRPIKQTAEAAHSDAADAQDTADSAMATATDAREEAAEVAEEIGQKLDRIEENQIEQQREARARSYYLRQITEAIKQADDIEADKLPDIEMDEFVRGDGGPRRNDD